MEKDLKRYKTSPNENPVIRDCESGPSSSIIEPCENTAKKPKVVSVVPLRITKPHEAQLSCPFCGKIFVKPTHFATQLSLANHYIEAHDPDSVIATTQFTEWRLIDGWKSQLYDNFTLVSKYEDTSLFYKCWYKTRDTSNAPKTCPAFLYVTRKNGEIIATHYKEHYHDEHFSTGKPASNLLSKFCASVNDAITCFHDRFERGDEGVIQDIYDSISCLKRLMRARRN